MTFDAVLDWTQLLRHIKIADLLCFLTCESRGRAGSNVYNLSKFTVNTSKQ